jgi:glycosyltransferase involved in cell wall biosynthesis
VRILIWHGWSLAGSGSNVAAARTAEVFRAAGHDVLLLCQEPHPERHRWIDAHGTVDRDGPSGLTTNDGVVRAAGRCVVLRPRIGPVLPVFVLDRYEGFEARRFIDLSDEQLDAYLRSNVEALSAAAASHEPQATFTGHAIPGAAIGLRALGPRRYVARTHGSDLVYAVRLQDRYRELAREGLEAATAVVGSSEDAVMRYAEILPKVRALARVVHPGVDVDTFRPRPRDEALAETAVRLDADGDTARGRPAGLDEEVERALAERDATALDRLADRYDQEAPDADAAARLRSLAGHEGPIVGYLGKLIPQKGVEQLLAAHARLRADAHALVVGFGSHREWLEALRSALRRGDRAALAWLAARGMPVDGTSRASGARAATFTGRLDHRYAPGALAAMDLLVVPSILPEAFGMVAIEGASAGALPVVARHSGLAEIAAALEAEVDRPGWFSFEPGEHAVAGLSEQIDALLALSAAERQAMRDGVRGYVARTWTWERGAADLLAAAGAG